MQNDKYSRKVDEVERMFRRIQSSAEFSGFGDYLQDKLNTYTARLCRERDVADFRFTQGQINVLSELVGYLNPEHKA